MAAARRQARTALGRDPNATDLFDGVPAEPYVPAEPRPERQAPSQAVRVLSLGEAANRLGVTRDELERMIDAGKIRALPTGFTRMIPTAEVERLTRR